MSLYAFTAPKELRIAPALRDDNIDAFALMMMDRRRVNRNCKAKVGEPVRGIENYVFVECEARDVFHIKRSFPAVRPVVHGDGQCYPLPEHQRQMLYNKRALWLLPGLSLLHDTDQEQAIELEKLRRGNVRFAKGQRVEFSLLNRRINAEVLQTRMEMAHDGHTLFLKLEALGRLLWLPADEVDVKQALEKAA